MTYMYGSRPRNNNGVVAQEIDNNSLQIQIQQQSTMIQELKNEIQDKKVYIDSILAHATNLDNELKNIEIGMSNHLDMGRELKN